jgi:putative DNA primase/helicase
VPSQGAAVSKASTLPARDGAPKEAPASHAPAPRKATPATRSASPPDDETSKRYFKPYGLQVEVLIRDILDSGHFALSPDGRIAQYVGGVYVAADPLVGAVRDRLGNRYRNTHVSNIRPVFIDQLRKTSALLSEHPSDRRVNVKNGMLDIETGELTPHDPTALSQIQLPVNWNPDAASPIFDAWLWERTDGQDQALLEAIGLVLCPWMNQRKTVFLYGPTRSGKSTLVRLIEALVGPYKAAVSLHQLGSNRFMAAELRGKLLNVAGDLSDRHLDDLSLFKQITGDDLIVAEHKHGHPFSFHNRALMVFSANFPPMVSEGSRAYFARVQPFLFPLSLEGVEDPEIESKLRAEIEGILVRLVEGARRWYQRGSYLPTDPAVSADFERKSDLVAAFVAESTVPDPGAFLIAGDLLEPYRRHCKRDGRKALGRNTFYARVDNFLGSRRRAGNTGPEGWMGYRLFKPADA